MKKMFEQFITDSNGWDMYITGQAGTGKTTGLAELVDYCLANNVSYVVCAYTHKACNVLRSKLPQGANVRTLHGVLKKRPSINQDATNVKHVNNNVKCGGTEEYSVMFIDEYSMVGEKDLMDIRADQEELDDGSPSMRVVWLGDPNQLPPVNDQQTVRPSGKYCLKLTKIYRQAADNPLMEPLQKLVSFIEGAEPTPLLSNEKFIRNQDILKWYDNDRLEPGFDGVMLAYTNERVQELNAAAEGKRFPDKGDKLFCPSNREFFNFVRVVPPEQVYGIELPWGDNLGMNSKYKTLEYLIDAGYMFVELEDELGYSRVFCAVFGHYDHKITKETLTRTAAATNLAIESKYNEKASAWARNNYGTKLAKERASAWRSFLAFDKSVICLDFCHAMTVHKSQGSTYKSVYLDIKDLAKAADIDYKQYLKLMYVAISRASDYVVTN